MACQFDSRRDELTRNLRLQFRRSKLCDRIAGSLWYPTARRTINVWADTYGYSRETVAAVIAAISPQVDWKHNLEMAENVLAHRPSLGMGLHKNIVKAERIRDTDRVTDIWSTMREMFPCDPKVCNFALNLVGNDYAVTVDGHAAQAALDNPLSTITLKWIPYNVFADCYRAAAAREDLVPATFQAIVWHAWKRLHPTAVKRQIRRV